MTRGKPGRRFWISAAGARDLADCHSCHDPGKITELVELAGAQPVAPGLEAPAQAGLADPAVAGQAGQRLAVPGHLGAAQAGPVGSAFTYHGKLELDPSRNDHIRVTFHDSCNPARGMGFFEEHRYVIKNVCNHFYEMPQNTIREQTFCCGGGGGQMWVRETGGERINELRVKQLVAGGQDDRGGFQRFAALVGRDADRALGGHAFDADVVAARVQGVAPFGLSIAGVRCRDSFGPWVCFFIFRLL